MILATNSRSFVVSCWLAPALWLVLRGCGFAAAVAAPQATSSDPAAQLPTIERVQAKLAELAAATDVPTEIKPQLTETMQQLLESLTQLADTRAQRKKLEEQVAAVPRELSKAKYELEQTPPPLQPVAASTPLERVRADKGEKEADLAAAKALRSELQAKIDNRKTRRAQATEMIAMLRTEIQKLESESPTTDPEGKTDPRLVITQRWYRDARLELARERLMFRQQDQRTMEAEEELLPLQIQLAERNVTRLEKEVSALTQAVSNRRESKVEATLRSHREALLAESLDPAESIVLKLGAAWTELVKKHGEAEREKTEAAARAERLAKELTDTHEAIDKDIKDDGTLRSGLGMKLQRQRGTLPSNSQLEMELNSVDLRIEEMGALQAQLEMTIDDLAGRGLIPSRTATPADDPANQREVARLSEMNRDIDNYTNDLIELKEHIGHTQVTVRDFRREIDSNVLWIRNARPYALSELTVAWHAFQWVVAPENLKTLLKVAVDEIFRRPDITLLWLLISGVLIAGGSKLRRAIRELGEIAAKRNQTAMRPTLRVMWMSGLLSLPLAFLLGIPGWRLVVYPGDSIYVHAVGSALLLMAALVLPLEMARQVVRRNGLAVLHFGFSEDQAHVVRSTLRFSIDAGLPLALLWAIIYNSGNSSTMSALARPLFLGGMILTSFALWRILHPAIGVMKSYVEKHPNGWFDRLRYVWHPAACAIPLVLGGLSLAGYSYSARQLAEQLYWTLWLVLALVIAGGVMRRWVTVSRRRLLLAQARQRASEAERREGTPLDLVVENMGPDLVEINAQTLRLINAFLTVMTVVGLAYMWAPVLPAVRFLDSVTLPWTHTVTDSEGTKELPITLANLLSSLPIILLTFVSVRNVPGLLENLLLQKLPLENAARYAITTLSSYVMLLVGVVYSANILGLKWESIQWLVAALGVGLGFGLQEIFANFVSGIILLFEQPIRVGDVVTLDGTTGAVSRIRMRATTVTNWDRQELIIPNKDLITGRLINWTLSDSTNRITVNVGVAYGSDTRRACEMLEKICEDHPNLCRDPAPVVAFEGFGDSKLNLVIRGYLKTLDVRIKTIHELHTEINERFHRAGIEIALPQRDLHIRSMPEGFAALVKDSQAAA